MNGFSLENELHHESGPGDECVAKHNIGADENTVRFFGNHRRTEVISTRVSWLSGDVASYLNDSKVTD